MKSFILLLVLVFTASHAMALTNEEANVAVAATVKEKRAEVLGQIYAQLPVNKDLVLDVDNIQCVSTTNEMGDYSVGTCLVTASAMQTFVVAQVSVSGRQQSVITKVIDVTIE